MMTHKTDGQRLIEALEGYIGQYLHFSDPNTALALATYAVMTWCYVRFYSIPYVTFCGRRGSGKSTALAIVGNLVMSPWTITGATAAPMFRKLLEAEGRLTILFDEAETTSKEARDMFAQFSNVGYKRGATVPKVIGGQVVDFPAFCPKIFASISDPNDALRSRCVVVRMERGQAKADYWPEQGEQEAIALVEQIKTVLSAIPTVAAEYPSFLTMRDREIWGALFGVAAALKLDAKTMERLTMAAADNAALKTAEHVTLRDTQDSEKDWRMGEYGRQALRDALRVVKEGERFIGTADLVGRMKGLIDGPWRTYQGTGLDAIVLADLLATVGAKPKVGDVGIKTTDKNGKVKRLKARGYQVAELRRAGE